MSQILIPVLIVVVVILVFSVYKFRKRRQTNENNASPDVKLVFLGTPPHVEDIIVSDQLPWSQKVKLECKISGYSNRDRPSVTWYKQEQGDLQPVTLNSSEIYEIQELRYEIQDANTYSCTACLIISQSLSSEQPIEVICRVEHPRPEQPIETQTESLQVMAKYAQTVAEDPVMRPSESERPPGPAKVKKTKHKLEKAQDSTPEVIYQGKTVAALELNVPSSHRARMGSDTLIPCMFTVEEPPVDPKLFAVFWYFQGKEILNYNNIVTSNNPAFSIDTARALTGDASLSISGVRVSDGGIYNCSILYSPERKEKEVSLFVQAPPEITITGRLAVINKESILSSSITGFYPVDIDIKWFREGETLNNYTVSTPQKNQRGTFSVNTTVTIIPTEEDKTRTFSFRVQHESLSGPRYKYFPLEYKSIGNYSNKS
ncbi:tapasin-related -like [Pelobates cultripes]|uniref:Tapasin-related -like n=1 Tax=Pelobates cultripes TaxID=61616 RepID=A0AAD1SW66_PELCU|nr:tapasin-related -like [Pelobates cultripes]